MGPSFTLDLDDPWRRRMHAAAERLRSLDEQRFPQQIERIHECIRRDAAWNLEAALACAARCTEGIARRISGTRFESAGPPTFRTSQVR